MLGIQFKRQDVPREKPFFIVGRQDEGRHLSFGKACELRIIRAMPPRCMKGIEVERTG